MVRFIILMQWGRVGSNLIVNIKESRIALSKLLASKIFVS